MAFEDQLDAADEVQIRQRRELAELFGFETRNKYEVTVGGRPLGFVAEQQKGLIGFLLRGVLGHWRPFELHVFDAHRQLVARANHPFRFFFQRLEVDDAEGRPVGTVERRWGLLTKRLAILDAEGQELFSVSSGLFRVWTFPFKRDGDVLATLKKQWGGMLREAFTDADRFELTMDRSLGTAERLLLVAAAIYVDLLYFEAKAS